MITKTTPAGEARIPWSGYADYRTKYREQVRILNLGSDTITYGEGRKQGGHWPWKPCNHTSGLRYSPGGRVRFRQESNNVSLGRWSDCWYSIRADGFGILGVPTVAFDPDTIRQCLSQIDLNSSNAVLLYSGVIQALPFLGGVMRFNRIMKDVWNHVSKTARKRPFTTVIKDLIQADFIDRFVISPTLADARQFQDATDYVLRVIQTARERNEHAFAVSATNKVVVAEKEATFRTSGPVAGSGEIWCQSTQTQYAESKAFMLVRARYDMTAVSPLKLWAQRVGLTRPLDSIWDLVPFSFVVDYFTRAGDFISALSDEMSQVDGLKGQIVGIQDLWYTIHNVSRAEARMTSWKTYPTLNGNWHWVTAPTMGGGSAVKRQSTFLRGQLTAPWSIIESLERRLSDYLTVSLDLSSTKKRTLAELVIQAKL